MAYFGPYPSIKLCIPRVISGFLNGENLTSIGMLIFGGFVIKSTSAFTRVRQK